MSDVALAGVEATAVMTPQVAANGSQDLNGLRESFRTFRRGIAGHRPLQVSQA